MYKGFLLKNAPKVLNFEEFFFWNQHTSTIGCQNIVASRILKIFYFPIQMINIVFILQNWRKNKKRGLAKDVGSR
jgi:hypothetical protein